MVEIKSMTSEDINICGNIYFIAFDYFSEFEAIGKLDTEQRVSAESWRKCYDFHNYFGQCIECKDKYAYCVKIISSVFLPGGIYPILREWVRYILILLQSTLNIKTKDMEQSLFWIFLKRNAAIKQ